MTSRDWWGENPKAELLSKSYTTILLKQNICGGGKSKTLQVIKDQRLSTSETIQST